MAANQHGLVGDSPEFRRLMKAARMVAATEANVLVIGENGTGKELIARAIHRQSPRHGQRFLAVNCAGISGACLDAALFDAGARGLGGTLFLDEVAELPPVGQARLLRFIERRHSAEPPDSRVIAATSRDLWSAVDHGSFRRDLYYRLYVVPLEVPPLRERVQDIDRLLDHYVGVAAESHGLDRPRFTATAERLLRRYRWPGNVREVRNLCERMVILFPGKEVVPENLPWEIRRGEITADDGLKFKLPATGINLQDLEVEAIRQALALAAGNKSRAARLLGLTRDTLLYRIQKYLINA
jgi:DNA-binding NtrC family response regulator